MACKLHGRDGRATEREEMDWAEVIKIGQAGLSIVVTIGLTIIGFIVAGIRDTQNKSASETSRIKGELHQATRELIDERLGAIRERQTEHSNRLRELERADQKLEIDVLKAIAELKDVVATKDDLNRLREEMNRNG
jgi:hypothetical protein